MNDPDRPIWHTTWFQRLLVVLVVAAIMVLVVPSILAVIYAVRPVLLPVLVALALAYAMNPVATVAEQRFNMPRVLTTGLLLLAVMLVLSGLGLYLVPKLVQQIEDLIVALPDYVRQLADWFRIDLTRLGEQLQRRAETMVGAATQPAEGAAGASQGADSAGPGAGEVASIAGYAVSALGVGIGVIGSTIGYVTYLIVAAVVVAFCFFFFLWKWPAMTAWFVPFIPVSRRERALEVLRMMDASVSGFIRGRLIQSAVLALVLSVGWWACGVPYFLLLGIGGGLLNLIPYAAVISWPLAVILAWVDALGGGEVSLWLVLFWPSVVYLLGQGLDGWVIEPLVQGKATELDPLTVLLAVLTGGTIAGLLGLLIAIPTAACGKILFREVLLPPIREWAAKNGGRTATTAEPTDAGDSAASDADSSRE